MPMLGQCSLLRPLKTDLSVSVVEDLMSCGRVDELEKYTDESSWGKNESELLPYLVLTVDIIFYLSIAIM